MVYLGELNDLDAQDILVLAVSLGIELIVPDQEHIRKAFTWTRQLNRIAAYDSFYLALAESLDCELWTADKKLVNAADQSWVKLIGE